MQACDDTESFFPVTHSLELLSLNSTEVYNDDNFYSSTAELQ